MEVRRNSRFDVNQEVKIYSNPFTKLESGIMTGYVTHGEYESFIGISGWESGSIADVELNDVFACKYFGGRVAWLNEDTDSLLIGISYDTFVDMPQHYIKNYLRIDAFIFGRGTNAVAGEYFYCLNGSGFEANIQDGTAAYDDRTILNSVISERSIKTSNQTFGYGHQHYASGWEDVIKISIPASTPEWKLTQMLNSEAVAVKGDNTLYGALGSESEYDTEYDEEYGDDVSGDDGYTLIDNYNYYLQHMGGSLSPIIRLVNIDKTTFSFNKRRNVFEVEAVMLG